MIPKDQLEKDKLYAQILSPTDLIITGTVVNLKEMDYGLLGVEFEDGIVYVTHASNILLYTLKPEEDPQ